MKRLIIPVLAIAVLAVGCGQKATKKSADEYAKHAAVEFEGNYVSPDYEKRAEGYDFVVVQVKLINDSLYHVSVRSRADKKQPTCTFDADARRVTPTMLHATVEGKIIEFRWTDDTLSIGTPTPDDRFMLNYYCSGGATLEGSYARVDELDKSLVDDRIFVSFLNYKAYSFDISSRGEGSQQRVAIVSYGFSESNLKDTITANGFVVNAEIDDLNKDGYPEVLVYTTSAGSGSYGEIIGYSANGGKSLSRITFNNIAENPELSGGYMGHDQFAIVEGRLCQRFPIYNIGDANISPTGKTRQITYTLKDRLNERVFVPDKVVEY